MLPTWLGPTVNLPVLLWPTTDMGKTTLWSIDWTGEEMIKVEPGQVWRATLVLHFSTQSVALTLDHDIPQTLGKGCRMFSEMAQQTQQVLCLTVGLC